MTCDEFRRRWLDVSPHPSAPLPQGWEAHCDTCADCAAWERRQLALDAALSVALFVPAPPGLAVRLAQIPAMAARPETPSGWYRLLEVAFLIVVALGGIGLSGTVGAFVLGSLWPVVDSLLQAAPLILGSPLVGYAQNLISTLIEALATLTLVALVLLQVRPEVLRDAATSSGQS